MLDRRLVATLAVVLAAPGAAHALPPPAWIVAAAVPRGGLMAMAAVAATRVVHERAAPRMGVLPSIPADALAIPPERKRASLLGGRDLDDAVRDWLGWNVTYYVGKNLAKGDASGVKMFGLKFSFD